MRRWPIDVATAGHWSSTTRPIDEVVAGQFHTGAQLGVQLEWQGAPLTHSLALGPTAPPTQEPTTPQSRPRSAARERGRPPYAKNGKPAGTSFARPRRPPPPERQKKGFFSHGCHPAAKCSITLERLALPEQHKEAAEKIPLAQRWIEDGAGTDEAIFGRLQRVERPQRRRVGIGVGHVVGRGSESGSGAGCCRKALQVGQHECPDVWNGYSGEGPHPIQKAERVGLVVGRAVGSAPVPGTPVRSRATVLGRE